ncbi:MAG TPA: ABC transporter permease, partial [Gemmatimonadaceae bacterium]|nr:ABC transporter permease [Gemmatimonadaceae bacterium]
MEQVRLAARGLMRVPGFAAAATLTLALGIGLSTAVFTVADALLLRALPVRDQDRLVALWNETGDGRFANWPLPLDQVREFERGTQALEQVAFFGFRGATPMPVRDGDRVLPLRGAMVSGNFFEVLGSRALLGRALRPEDDAEGVAPVVVLSHRAWQAHFGGDSAVIGRSLAVLRSGRSYPIVGVMPRGLEYPRGTDVWMPLIAHGAASGFLEIAVGELDLLARLRPGATPAQARAELTTYLGRPNAPAWQRELRGVVHTLPDLVLGESKPAVLVVLLAAALLLGISCVNVANLLFVRSVGRAREIVVRSALGASRGRLAGQLLTEAGVLSVAGGLLGIGVAVAAVTAFEALAPARLPRLEEIGVDGGALTAALVITALAMLLAGLGPALLASRAGAHDVLRSGARQSAGRRLRSAAELLVVAQVALAAVSLSAAALMTRSLVNLMRVDLAFEPSQLLVAEVVVRQDQRPDTREQRVVMDLLLPHVEALPGVRSASPVLAVPFASGGAGIDGRLSKPGQSREEAAANPIVNLDIVAANYFATLGTPVLQGRAFTDEDREGAAPVVIVSRSLARQLWPGEDALGQRVTVPGGEATVVGVVPDTRYRELHVARPSAYFPRRQSPFPVEPTTLLIRTTGDPAAVMSSLARTVAE